MRGEVPLLLPEKLAANKVLVEVEPREGNATDLAGDAGAARQHYFSGVLAAGNTSFAVLTVVYRHSEPCGEAGDGHRGCALLALPIR